MISVIVPIYNVKPYLKQCIDSILAQTYIDLEIVLVDDGSTDGSGIIADSYSDPRIHVFHTENHGLSAARNVGINNSHGDYLFFVDSDDWLDNDILESLVSNISDSDLICFGYTDQTDNTIICFHPSCSNKYIGLEAFWAYQRGSISVVIWNKLYRSDCFSSLRFPEGRICEDLSTTYRILMQASSVKCIDKYGYHHRIRSESISNTHNLSNIIDAWIAVKEQYFYCMENLEKKYRPFFLQVCIRTIIRAFAWKNTYTKTIPSIFYEMSHFAKTHCTLSICLHFSIKTLIGLLCIRSTHPFVFSLLNFLLRISRNLKGKEMK